MDDLYKIKIESRRNIGYNVKQLLSIFISIRKDWDKILSYLTPTPLEMRYVPPTILVSTSSGLIWALMYRTCCNTIDFRFFIVYRYAL